MNIEVSPKHDSVLLEAAVEALMSDPAADLSEDSGIYVDATFGRGGHSRHILSKLGAKGRLIGVDQDPEAVSEGQAWQDPRFEMVYSSFEELDELVRLRGLWGRISGVLFDLGVSSPQLDQVHRGFSFQTDGPLDMRMNNDAGETAAEWLFKVDHQELVRVLRDYGEERFAKRIARAIIERRKSTPITTTKQLADLIAEAVPIREHHKHPATRSFQAIRIAVNRELEALEKALATALELLAVGGKIVVISFHSLEDRIVKRFFQHHHKGDPYPKDMPIMANQMSRRLQILGKAIKPSGHEVAANNRARSAVMRVAEKL